jgi:hypothetical protein
MMLDEVGLRRPEFQEGYPVTLADGQLWHVPRPKFKFRPRFVDGKVEIGGGATYGPESSADLDILYGIVESTGSEFLRVKFSLAVRLLRVNYTLTDDDLVELLVMEPGDKASDARWEEISNALMGTPPKPLPAT